MATQNEKPKTLAEERRMGRWTCRKCGQLFIAKERPSPMRWSDGHVCHFYPEQDGIGLEPPGVGRLVPKPEPDPRTK